MINIYSHLSMRDVEEKDLILHGKRRKEEALKPLVEVRKCRECGEENAPIAVYCVKCGKVLSFELPREEMKKRDEAIRNLTQKSEEATKRLENLERRLKESKP